LSGTVAASSFQSFGQGVTGRDSVDPYFVHLLVEEAEITLDSPILRSSSGRR
jgi:hypothetical protein